MAQIAHKSLISSATGMSPFYAMHGYHPRTSFSPDDHLYEGRDKVLAAKAEDIAGHMQRALEVAQGNMRVAQERMTKQANRRRKDITYKVGDMVWLSSTNITTERPSKKLDDKQLGPFKILAHKGHSYQLDLPESMRNYGVFHVKLLRKDPDNPLPGQINPPPQPTVVADEEEWPVEEILAARRHYGRVQYKVKWQNIDRDNTWYNTDDDQFTNSQSAVDRFYQEYPAQPGGPNEMVERPRRQR